jgi:Mn-dependent DtxR family transcriptional regulator
MYLETIHILSQRAKGVRAVDVAEYMGFSKPSVSRAVGLLRSGGYLDLDANGCLVLTDEGRRVAGRTYERHLFLTNFFVSIGVKKETAEKAGVGQSTVDRIRSGQLTAEGKPEKPKSASKPKPEPVFTAPETAQELITPRELDALRALIGQAVKAFAGIECATAADSYNLGQTFGLLTAAQMILEGDE